MGRPRFVEPGSRSPLSLRLPTPLYSAAIAKCEAQRTTISEYVRGLMEADLQVQVEDHVPHETSVPSEPVHNNCPHPSARMTGDFCNVCHQHTGRAVV